MSCLFTAKLCQSVTGPSVISLVAFCPGRYHRILFSICEVEHLHKKQMSRIAPTIQSGTLVPKFKIPIPILTHVDYSSAIKPAPTPIKPVP